ncbi:MAG: cell division protein FtsA [Bacteroidia bacterium]|nr:cell division protein FtsA [Bacteroidia bacterium]
MPMNERYTTKEIYGVVDIGTQNVRVLVGQIDADHRVNVLGVGKAPSKGIDESGVVNIEQVVESIRKAYKQAEQQSGTALSRVWVSINHMHLHGEESEAIITFPDLEHEISSADIERLRQQAIQRPPLPDMELIHVLPQYYSLDHRSFIRDPLGMTGIRLEGYFYLIYAPQMYLMMLRRCFQRLGLEIEGFIARPVAAAEVFISKEHKASNSALIYLSTHTTSVVAYREGILRLFKVLPLGGHHVTMDIREMLRYILPAQAEELKIQQGVAFAQSVPEEEVLRLRISTHPEPLEISRRLLAQVIQARMEETMLFVAREIDQVGLLEKLYGGIHLAGGGAQMQGMEALTEYVLRNRAQTVQVSSVLGRGIMNSVKSPAMAGAVATLYLAPIMNTLMPPPPTPSKDAERSTRQRLGLFHKLRSFLEKGVKLPQDLVD